MSDKRVCVVIILDGAADVPHPKFNFKTPYEVAKKPSLDMLAQQGVSGMLYPLGIGKVGGSDTSHMALLGDDPWSKYTGRGALEVAGVGIGLKKGDVSIRCNYCTVDDNLLLINRTAGYPREGTEALEEAVNKIKLSDPDVKFTFRNSADYRCVVHFRGKGISPDVSDMDPSYHVIIGPEDNIKNPEDAKKKIITCKPKDKSPEAIKMAKILNEFFTKSHEVLKKHPFNVKRKADGKPEVNAIMPRGPGATPELVNFQTLHGIKGGCVAGTGLIRGLCALMGMETPMKIQGATGYIDTNYENKAKAALELIQKKGCEFVIIHIEGIDEVGHDKNFDAKVKAIEDASERLIKPLVKDLPENSVIIVTSDHTTSTVKGDHTGDPVPMVVWAKDKLLISDDCPQFSEKAALKGGLGKIMGKDFMPYVLTLMGVTKKFGA